MHAAHDSQDEIPGNRSEATADADEPPQRPEFVTNPVTGAGLDAPIVAILDPDGLVDDVPRRWLSDRAHAAVRSLGAVGEIRVRLVRDAQMADAHQRHMGTDSTTDVITFDLAQGDDTLLDTDLLVCVDQALRQAEHLRIPIERELLLYVLHGALHCLGYDDRNESDACIMHAREDEVLTAIGVGATYALDNRLPGSAQEACA